MKCQRLELPSEEQFEKRTEDRRTPLLVEASALFEREYEVERGRDVVNFIETYADINLMDWQDEAVLAWQQGKHVIGALPRRSGKSSLIAGLMLHSLIYGQRKSLLYVAPTMAMSSEFMRVLKHLYMNLPEHMKPGVAKWDRYHITLDNGNSIDFHTLGSKDLYMGKRYDDMYFDEPAHGFASDWLDQIVGVCLPLMNASKGRLFMLSTPGNERFRSLFELAQTLPHWKAFRYSIDQLCDMDTSHIHKHELQKYLSPEQYATEYLARL